MKTKMINWKDQLLGLKQKTNKKNWQIYSQARKIRERTQSTTIRNDKVAITTDFVDTKMIVKEYYGKLNAHKIGSLYEMDQFLENIIW